MRHCFQYSKTIVSYARLVFTLATTSCELLTLVHPIPNTLHFMLNTKIRSLAGIFWAFLTWFRINFVSAKHEMRGLWILKCQTFCNGVAMDNCSEYYKQFSCNAKLFLLKFLATFPATTINKKNSYHERTLVWQLIELSVIEDDVFVFSTTLML